MMLAKLEEHRMDKITGSPYYNSVAHLTETIILNNTTVGETNACNILIEEHTLVIDTGINLTIEEGKTLIPNVFG